jgi:DNA processing protein
MEYREVTADELLGPLNEVEEKNAPKQLFVAGDVGILALGARISIVGSRKASPEGLARARKLARALSERHMVVVSGLAEGIDTAAHTAAIEMGGKTVSVIGTALDKVYPSQNARLQEEIMREHLCISQFPPGYPTRPGNFPIRNRTMALISDATVIIEAGESSGSLHQGWEALRLGRGLWIAKSVVEDPELTWPEKMLHYGAGVLSDETLGDFFASLPERMQVDLNDAIPF